MKLRAKGARPALADPLSRKRTKVTAGDWKEKVYQPDILSQPEKLYKKPGYTM